MNEGQVGWITAIVVGGIAGWLANKFMHAHAHLLTDVVAGVVGACICADDPSLQQRRSVFEACRMMVNSAQLQHSSDTPNQVASPERRRSRTF